MFILVLGLNRDVMDFVTNFGSIGSIKFFRENERVQIRLQIIYQVNVCVASVYLLVDSIYLAKYRL